MSPLIDPSTEADLTPRTDAPPPPHRGDGNGSAFGTINPHLDRWLKAVGQNTALSAEALIVAAVLARTVGLGRVTFTNWQRVNDSLGRHRTDPTVLDTIRELQEAGYLGRFQGTRYNKSRGWSLKTPGREL